MPNNVSSFPTSPLEMAAIEDGEFEEVITAASEPSEAADGVLERMPPQQESITPDKSLTQKGKAKMAKSVLREMADNGQSIADLFDEEASLAKQYGVVEQMASMSIDCLVCAKPRKTLEDIETSLFLHQENYKSVALRYDLTVDDIQHHVNECVLNRKARIPAGVIVNKYVKEVEEFAARMESFRMELDSSMDSEAIHTYLSVMGTFQSVVNNLNNMSSPDDEALMIVKQILNPLLLQVSRDVLILIESFKGFANAGNLIPGKEDPLNQFLRDSVESLLKTSLKARFTNAVQKLAEVKGVDIEVILGSS